MRNSFKKPGSLAGLFALLTVVLMLFAACGGSNTTANSNQQSHVTPTATFAPLPSPRATTAPGTAIPVPGTPTPPAIPTAISSTGTPPPQYTYSGSLCNTSVGGTSNLTLDVATYSNVSEIKGTILVEGFVPQPFDGFISVDGVDGVIAIFSQTSGTGNTYAKTSSFLKGSIDRRTFTGNGTFDKTQKNTGTWTLNSMPTPGVVDGTISGYNGNGDGDRKLTVTIQSADQKFTKTGLIGIATFDSLFGGGAMMGLIDGKLLSFSVIGDDANTVTDFTTTLDPNCLDPSGSLFHGNYTIYGDNLPNGATSQSGEWFVNYPVKKSN